MYLNMVCVLHIEDKFNPSVPALNSAAFSSVWNFFSFSEDSLSSKASVFHVVLIRINMNSFVSSLKKLLCYSLDGTTVVVDQRLKNPPSGPAQSPPTALPTLQDRIKLVKEMVDTCNIDALIQAIDQFLKSKLNPASSSTPPTPTGRTDLTLNWTSAIRSGATILNFVNEHIEKIDAQDDFFRSDQGLKVVEEILQELGQPHWIFVGLSIITYLLTENFSHNGSECIQLLKCIFDLTNHIQKLKGHFEQEDKLRAAFVLIVQGCMTCASQLHSDKFFRFLKSSVDSQVLNSLSSKIYRVYQHLILTSVREIQTTVTEINIDQHVELPVLPPPYPEGAEIQTTVTEINRDPHVELPGLHPAYPAYPKGAVGLEKPLEELKKMLDLQTQVSSRVVVIYGMGGIGKTTLANALVATLAEDLQYHKYNFTKVVINDSHGEDYFKSMQQQILRDCFPTYQSGRLILIRNSEEGRSHIAEAFNCETKTPVFIFIDNVLRSKDLKELLPEDLRGLPRGSRILVTTRNLAVTDLFLDRGIRRYDYAVSTLSEEDSIQILYKNSSRLNQKSNLSKQFMQIAGGIPLVLEIIGSNPQKYKVETSSQILEASKHGGEASSRLGERLIRSVYNELELSTQEAFLDICCFFNGVSRRYVEYIVGVEEVTSLAEAALVTVSNAVDEVRNQPISWVGDELVKVHDIVQAAGRQMAEQTRLRNLESLSGTAQDQVQGIRGVWLDDNKYTLEESKLGSINNSLRRLMLGDNNSLRILRLGDGISFNAHSNKTFKELRYLRLDRDIPSLPMNLEGLPSLSVYSGPIFKEFLSKLPPHLRYLSAQPCSCSAVDKSVTLEDSKSIQAVGNSSLEVLDLSWVENMRIMLDGRFDFYALKILSLAWWREMEELPPQVFGLHSLNELILRGCEALKRVPKSIANLRALTHLDLSRCENLEKVSSSLGELTYLRYLDLSYCGALRKLPDSFGQLSELEYLSLCFCSSMVELPGNFAQLRSLKSLDLTWCGGLKELPPNFPQLPSLEVLWMQGVHRLLEGFNQMDNNWKIIID